MTLYLRGGARSEAQASQGTRLIRCGEIKSDEEYDLGVDLGGNWVAVMTDLPDDCFSWSGSLTKRV